MANKYCIGRVHKLTTHGRGAKTLSQSLRHLDKHLQSADISRPELSHLNRSILLSKRDFRYVSKILDQKRDEYNQAIDEYNVSRPEGKPPKRHMQKRASQCFEGVLTFSPDMADSIDIDSWVRANCEFLQKEFQRKGCKAVRIELHMDEETPHIHFIFAVVGEKDNYMAKDILGGRGDLSKLQDRYAEAMEQFGLKRGHSRYNEYENIRRRAINNGYGNPDGTITYEQVKAYADNYGLKVPKLRRHKSTREWKASVEAEVLKKEDQLISAETRLKRTKALIKEQGELIPEYQMQLVDKCESYERLIALAAKVHINHEGEDMSLLDYLLDLQRKQGLEQSKIQEKQKSKNGHDTGDDILGL